MNTQQDALFLEYTTPVLRRRADLLARRAEEVMAEYERNHSAKDRTALPTAPAIRISDMLDMPEVRKIAKMHAGGIFGVKSGMLEAFPCVIIGNPSPVDSHAKVRIPTKNGLVFDTMPSYGAGLRLHVPTLHLRHRITRCPIAYWQNDKVYDDNTDLICGYELPPKLATAMDRIGEFDDALVEEHNALAEITQSSNAASKAKAAATAWHDIHLPEKTIVAILDLQNSFRLGGDASPKGLLLYGPPGTGKTLIAQKIATTTGSQFFNLSLPDLKAGHIGQSGQNVRELWNKVRADGNAIVFIDECEGVFAKRGAVNTDAFNAEIVQAFLAEWDGISAKDSASKVWVIGATNRRELLDEAIVSRFENEIEIPQPDSVSRYHILAAELGHNFLLEVAPERIGRLTVGFAGRDLRTLSKKLKAGDAIHAEEDDLRRAVESVRGRGSTQSEAASWDTLILPRETKEELQTVCDMLLHADILSSKGISLPRGILLKGSPGTGKTQIARTLAAESSLNFISVTTSDLKAGYTGQSGQKVKEVFERARSMTPCILYVDEIDIVAPARGSGDAFTQEIIGQFLQEMDGARKSSGHVFLLASTNREDTIDPAVLSRFPQQIEIGLPDVEARTRIIQTLLKNKPSIVSDSCIGVISRATDGMSGRDLRSLIERAEQLAVKRALGVGIPESVCVADKDVEVAATALAAV